MQTAAVLCEISRSLKYSAAMVMSWIAAAVVGTVGYFVYDAYRKSRYWPEKGIPALPYVPVFGSLLDVMRTGLGQFDLKWTRKLGRIFGSFDGPFPVIVTSDLEMLKNITVKDFGTFVNRRELGLSGPIMEHALTEIRDQHWKDIRGVLIPAFTSGRLKQMNNLMKECCDELMTNLDTLAVNGEDFLAKELYSRLTLDVIATTFFATKINFHDDPNSTFVKHAKRFFEFGLADMPLLLIAMLFPKAQPLLRWFGFQMLSKEAVKFFVNNTEQIIRLRMESKQYRRDFLQLMLSSLKSQSNEEKPVSRETQTTVQNETNADVAASAMSMSTSHEKPLTHSNYKLSLEELVAQSIIFFLGGYETTATTLTFMSYCLATSPEIQERLRREILAVVGSKKTIEYDDLAEMPYLDQCVNETLRLYPPLSRAERQCGENWSYGGVEYEKGTVFEIPIFAIHRDPEYWPEPEVYDPERFSKENRANIKPYSFMAFGQGPRNCIGMRFAYYEIKMVMASILRKYRLVLSPQTEVPLVLKDSLGFMSTKKGVWVKVDKLQLRKH